MTFENSAIASEEEEMLRPPRNGTMKVLDRSLFQKTIRTVSAVIHDKTRISQIKSDLWDDALQFSTRTIISPIQPARGYEIGKKCMILKPNIKKEDPSTWSPKLTELIGSRQVDLEPWSKSLSYDDWHYTDIMKSVIPSDLLDEMPHGYSAVGHIIHFNLREQFLPYKHLVGSVILDKIPGVRTVINKVERVGAKDPFRTFNYEVLAGVDDMVAEVSEQNCIFRLNYAKVYWNPRLEGEHKRLVDLFKPGEAVADVMAGVGPFSIPAGKKKCFVYANDLNPESFIDLKHGIARNKVIDSPSSSCFDTS